MPSGLGDLFGEGGEGGFGAQFLLWNVGSALVSGLLAPVIQGLSNVSWSAANPSESITGLYVPLSPADLASMVVKNILSESAAASEARLNGLTSNDFGLLVTNHGEPPGLEWALQAYRRKFIPLEAAAPADASVESAVRTSNLYDVWQPIVSQMASNPISVADAVEATLRQQASQSDMETEAWASGIDSDRFQILLDTAGNPPSPGELVEFYRRSLIPMHGTGPTALTFQQGIYEGDAKDKWEPLYEKLIDYVPPPRTITTLLSHGVITSDQATQLFQENGLTAELAGIYAASATSEKLAANKVLAVGNVEKLYYDRLIDKPTAAGMLGQLGYTDADAAYILEIQDFTRASAAYNSAVSRVGTLYISHKLTRASAVAALQSLDVPADASTQLFSTWDTEYAANVKTLTPGQIADCYKYQIKDLSWCIDKLGDLGYDAHDAWVLCSVAGLGAAPSEPAEGRASGMAESTTEAG